ncbi:hypothetical protein FGRMN_8227 [Fusarium graminum]|nr:hypothetical protein FGRMN_8227 [Fusarium graminum]
MRPGMGRLLTTFYARLADITQPALIDAILSTYNKIRDVKGLPKAFEEVAQNLPLAKETLEIAQRQLQQNNPTDNERRVVEPIIKSCQEKIEALNLIFTKIEKKKEQDADGKDWSTLLKFYHNVVVPMGKAHRVETLMSDMMNKLRVLAIHQTFKTAARPQIEKLEEAIEELSQVEPSLPDSEFETSGSNINQTINDRGNGFLCTGGCMENNLGNMFKADRDMNLDNDVGAMIPEWLESISTPLRFDEKLHELSQIAHKTPGSGDWFLKSPVLNDWINGELQKLWSYGIAGAGKSVITSVVIDHLQNLRNRFYGDQNVACIYVYFDYREQKSQTLTNVLSSLLVQVLRSPSKASPEIEEKYDSCRRKGSFPTEDAYLHMILSQAKRLRRIYMFLGICRRLPRKFHILFTSRPGLNSQLVEPDCEVEIVAQPADIKAYLDNFIEGHRSMRALIEEGQRHNTLFREYTLNSIVNGSQGMFLLAHLHISNLASTHTLQEFENTLTKLSDDLAEVYQAALDRIETQVEKQRNTAVMLLAWIAFAKRPLTIAEATQALYIQNAALDLDIAGSVLPKISTTIETEWALTSVCAGMVVGVVENNTTYLHFAHSSAEQHLKDGLLARSQNTYSLMTEVCLRCLIDTPVKPLQQLSSAQITKDQFRNNYPFFHYAANYWGKHLTDRNKGSVYKLAWDFLSGKERLGYAVLAMDDVKVSRQERVAGLHMAAYFGLTNLVKKAVGFQKHLNINSRTKRDETPLHWAIIHGRQDFVEFLISQQADVNLSNADNRTPLHLAIIKDDSKSMSLLLSTGHVDLELKDSRGFTPLIVAVTEGKASTVETLLGLGANPDSEDNDDWTALRWAAQLGYKMIIKLLIRYDASVSSPTKDGWTLLRWAASEGRADIITLLSGMKIDLDAADKEGVTALRWAVNYNCAMATWVLLQANAYINKPDRNGMTALHAAVETHHQTNSGNDVLWLLLANGANVNAQTRGSSLTPLHVAAFGGSESVIWLLLSKGADLNKLDASDRTALHCAVASEHIQATQLLLWKISRLMNAVDHEKRTVLHYAASQGNVAMAEMLVNWGAEINARDRSGQIPLHIAVLQSHEDLAIYLVNKGADLEISCKKNRVRVSLDELVMSMESVAVMDAISQVRGTTAGV